MSKKIEDIFMKTSRCKSFKKNKKKTYNETIDYQAKRHQKINFKKYLNNVFEEELEDEIDDLNIK